MEVADSFRGMFCIQKELKNMVGEGLRLIFHQGVSGSGKHRKLNPAQRISKGDGVTKRQEVVFFTPHQHHRRLLTHLFRSVGCTKQIGPKTQHKLDPFGVFEWVQIGPCFLRSHALSSPLNRLIEPQCEATGEQNVEAAWSAVQNSWCKIHARQPKAWTGEHNLPLVLVLGDSEDQGAERVPDNMYGAVHLGQCHNDLVQPVAKGFDAWLKAMKIGFVEPMAGKVHHHEVKVSTEIGNHTSKRHGVSHVAVDQEQSR